MSWRQSCLTGGELIADEASMLSAAIRFFDIAVVTLIFTALT